MAKKKILIIEDEQSLIRSLAFALSDKYEIIEAADGLEGLDKARTDLPDLILLDINLPSMEGTEIIKKLKEDPSTENIDTLVLTNLSDEDTISRILAVGGKDYLVKADWQLDDIVAKVDSFFE